MKQNTVKKNGIVRRILKRVFAHIARHKYIVTIILFVAIILFIDSNSLWSKRELISQNDELRREIAELEEACRRDSARLEELKNDSNEIIRVAREIYFMKRSNEDVYIINE